MLNVYKQMLAYIVIIVLLLLLLLLKSIDLSKEFCSSNELCLI